MTPKQQLALLEAEAKAYSESIDKQIGHEKHRRIKTAAYYGYLDAAKKYQGEIRALEERMERMVETLVTVKEQADNGIFPHLPVETVGAAMCINIKGIVEDALNYYNTFKSNSK